MKDASHTIDGLLQELQTAHRRIAELEETVSTRRRAEQSLRDANMRLQSLIDANIIGVTIATFSGGIIETNDHYLRTIGYTREEFEQGLVDWRNITPPEWLPADENCLEELRTRGVSTPYEKEYIRRDGSRVTIFLTCALLPGPEREIASFVLDITERKRMERALRDQRQRFEGILRGTNAGTWEWNVQTGETIFNARWAEIIGYTLEEIAPVSIDTWVRFCHPDDLKASEALLEKHFRGEIDYYECEARMQHKDGHWVWVLDRGRVVTWTDDGKPLMMMGTHQDITERKHAEEALQISEAKYRLLHKSMRDAFVRVDIDGSYSEFNEAYVEMLGYPREELEHLTYFDITPEKWHAFEDEIIKNQVLVRGYSDIYEKEYRRKDGTVFPIEIRTILIRDDEGRPTGMWGLVRDITERKRAEEVLRASESFRRRVFDSSPIPIVVMDTVTWAYLDCNQAAIEIYRFASREQTLGKTPLDVSSPVQYDGTPTPERVRYFIERALTEGKVVFEWRHQRPSGEIWDAEVHLMSFRDGQREFLQFTLQDITERKRMLGELQASEERYRTIFEQTGNASVLLGEDTTILLVNSNFEKLSGYTKQELEGKMSWTLFVDSRDLEMMKHYHEMRRKESFTTPPPNSYDFRFINRQGEKRDIFLSTAMIPGTKINIASLLDITERKQSEEALRESEEKYRMLTEDMKDVVWSLDADTLRYTYVSNSAKYLRGFTSREIMDEPVDAAFPPENRESIGELIRQRTGDYLSGKVDPDQSYTDEIEQTCKDGSSIWTEIISRCYLNEKTGHMEIRGVTRDITARKQAVAEQIRLQEQLLQAQKMESVGRLAGGIAHDFNNMLMAISGHTELALMQCGEDSPLYADLKVIEKSVQRSAELNRQLLGFARKQTVAPKVLDLNETVAGVFKMLRRLIGEDIDFAWRPGIDLWQVKIDPTQIDQLLMNLCVNARDAISGVGKINIETENKVFDEVYCDMHSDYIPGEYVMLAVSDTGCGMDQETLANIFEPFFTTKGMGKGTGLGLATVYGIVKQNEGFLNVYSEPGKGTTFKIYLRRFEGETQAKPSEAMTEIHRGHGETILMVEDDPISLDTGKTMLERLGYTVLSASTPHQALQLAHAHAAEIALLMSDVIMPEMNGRDLANMITEVKPGLKCLFSSGYTANVITHRGILDEGVNFLQKPYSMKDLAIKVRQALE